MGWKWYKKLVITVGILAVLVMALRGWVRMHGDSPEEDAVMITDFPMKVVAGAALVNEKGSVALMIQDGEIEILNAPSESFFSASDRKAFLYRISHIPVKERLGEVEDWGQYGLEYPRARITLFLTEGRRVALELGDQTPFGDAWYLRRGDDTSLYLVDPVTARMMNYSMDDFRELDVLPVILPESLEELTWFQLTRGGDTLEILGENRDGMVRCFLTAPFEAALNWQTVSEKILAPLSQMESLGFIGEHLSDEDSRFEGEGVYQIQMRLAGEGRTLLFASGGEDTFYCKNPDNGQVILVGGEVVRVFLNQTGEGLIGTTLYPANAADMESVTAVAAGVREELELRGQGDLLRGYSRGKEFSQAETLKLFQTLTMIPPAEPLEETGAFSEEPLLTLYFRRRNGMEDIVELIPISQRRCAVQMNGAASFTTYTSAIEEIIRLVKGMGS